MNILVPAVTYFSLIFGAGFVLGTVRVLWLVPRVGVRIAELSELPLMLVAVFVAARWVNRQFVSLRTQSTRVLVGLVALAFLLAAEVALGVVLRAMSPTQVLVDRDPVSGAAYYLGLCVYAMAPWLLGRVGGEVR
jgi:hypothetical protein